MITNPLFLKRVQLEEKEFSAHPHILAGPLPSNPLEWHFTIRGQKGTIYEGGLYHGVVYLGEKYPFTAPDILFMTVR